MFSNILDTVRIANENQLIAIEAFLMRSALSGTPAVLSPNQAIDSSAHDIGLGGMRDTHLPVSYYIISTKIN